VSWLGRRHPGRTIELTPVDPLGDAYAELLASVGLEPPVRTIALAGEDILETFGESAFDLAYARNALDHSADPVEIIRQMVRVVVPGGAVVLRHYAEEAEKMRYEDLHQFNFTAEDGRLIVWNRRRRVDISGLLTDLATTTVHCETGSGHADWIVAMIRRDQ
jgi:SAM-dependent methyltransferase